MTLLLVDGTNTVMRCASVPGVSPEDAMRFALAKVRRAIDVVGATHVVIAFDTPESLRRKDFPEYKAHRTGETGPWVVAGTEAFTAAGFYCTSVSGYEADDVIAAIARRVLERQGDKARITVLSTDSDLRVLASPQITVWAFDKRDVARGIVPWTPEKVCEHYGIPTPAHLTLYKALVGEKGDGVPGVPGIGPVKARKLIADYGDYETLCRMGVLAGHERTCELAIRMVSLFDFAPVPEIPKTQAAVRRVA